MANNYLRSSTKVRCTPAQTQEYIEAANNRGEGLIETPFENDISGDVVVEDNGFVLCHSEQIDLDENFALLAAMQLKHPDFQQEIRMSWAYVCDKARPDEFGGGTVHIIRGVVVSESDLDVAKAVKPLLDMLAPEKVDAVLRDKLLHLENRYADALKTLGYQAKQEPRVSDSEALDEIQGLLDGKEWGADHTADVAAVVRSTGRVIRDVQELDEPGEETER